MTSTAFDPAAYVDQAAALLDLPLTPAHRPGVIENMARLAALAALVTSFALPEEVEPGPVFRP